MDRTAAQALAGRRPVAARLRRCRAGPAHLAEGRIPELTWLPEAPDWTACIKAAEQEAAPTWSALMALADVRLDFLQTDRLARLLARAFPEPPVELASRPVRLAVLGSSTTAHLIGGLRVAGLRRGLWIETWEPDYGQYRQALLDGAELAAFAPTAVLLALDARHLTAGLAPGADRAAADAAFDTALGGIVECWQAARRLGALTLQQTALPVLPRVFGENEERLAGSRAALLGRLNEALPAAAREHGVHLVAAHVHALQDGLGDWCDPALWFRGKQEISPAAAPMFGELVARVLAAAQGRSRKALVLDLDNTLWGGVVGDDGVEGLELGQGSGEGEAFAAVQAYARDLSARGVVLAVCSKNDEAVARHAFDTHPEMVLKATDVAAFVANWDDKASNLRKIAEELKLGLDALVFLDDNPFERNLVREMLPEVAVPELPNDDPAFVPGLLARAGYFEALELTKEDQARAAQYQDNRLRASAQAQASDIGSYLSSLEMRLLWRPFDEAGLSRIVQLINKTNQFNLTTRRIDAEAARRLVREPGVAALQFRLQDRFGDNGMIAVVVARRRQDAARLETWLMSCRVLGRGVEQAILGVVAEAARSLGCRRLIGEYLPTERNGMVAELYPRLGFRRLGADEEPCGASHFELGLDGWRPAPHAIEVVETASA